MIVSGLPYSDQTTEFTHTVTDLDPKTEYTANVYYSTDTTTVENIPIGAQSITTEASERPSDWDWSTNISKGATVPKYGEILAPITAAEWNDFCARINQFRAYKSLAKYPFTTVSQGAKMTAAIVNQAITAISAIPGHGTLPTPSNAIAAAFWLGLAAALNSVI